MASHICRGVDKCSWRPCVKHLVFSLWCFWEGQLFKRGRLKHPYEGILGNQLLLLPFSFVFQPWSEQFYHILPLWCSVFRKGPKTRDNQPWQRTKTNFSLYELIMSGICYTNRTLTNTISKPQQWSFWLCSYIIVLFYYRNNEWLFPKIISYPIHIGLVCRSSQTSKNDPHCFLGLESNKVSALHLLPSFLEVHTFRDQIQLVQLIRSRCYGLCLDVPQSFMQSWGVVLFRGGWI